LRIVVNTRLLLKNKLEGIGWFTYETLKRITQQHPEHHFVFAFDRDFDADFIFSDNITPIVIKPQARHPFLYYAWFEFSIPNLLKDLKPDLFLSPDGYLSLSAKTKSLAVVHDLNFEHYPEYLPYLSRKYYQHFFPKYCKAATRIATVSEYSKKDIVDTYKIASEKIDVVYNGANEIYKPLPKSEKQLIKQKYSQSADYFLYVGSLHPRKNVSGLLKAFDAFKKSSSNNIKLIIAGEKYWWTDEMKNAYDTMQFKNDVIFLGMQSANQLKYLIASAMAMVYVSFFEGFGIPILEAMRCDVPVITSNVTSMPEVAGNATLLADPFSVDSIKDAMQQIAGNESLRKDLIEKGRIRKNNFSWDKTASLLWESIEKCFK